ncbi:MAG: hypothetical protein U0231_21375 [Nitrospiraceae bacterium]
MKRSAFALGASLAVLWGSLTLPAQAVEKGDSSRRTESGSTIQEKTPV